MLPWSRIDRFRLIFLTALLVAVLGGPGRGTPALGQQQPAAALLLSGPTPVKGIPVYAPNRIPAFEGLYSLRADPGTPSTSAEAKLRILYSRQDLLVPQAWVPRRCGSRRLYQIPDYETFTLCYNSERGFFLFFFFPESEEPAYWCAFTDPFLERFLFLTNFVDRESEVPFPAVLQVGTYY